MMPFGPVPGGEQYAAAEVLDKRHAFFSGERGQLTAFGRSHKALHEKIAAVHLQNQAGLRTDGPGVVVKGGVVGGADLAQFRTARFENFRKAKTSADLHQFAARNDDLCFLRREMTQVEQQRGGAIVDDHRSLGTAQLGEASLEIGGASASATGDQVDFQVDAASGGQGIHGRTAQVGMHDHPGAVDHRLQAG